MKTEPPYATIWRILLGVFFIPSLNESAPYLYPQLHPWSFGLTVFIQELSWNYCHPLTSACEWKSKIAQRSWISGTPLKRVSHWLALVSSMAECNVFPSASPWPVQGAPRDCSGLELLAGALGTQKMGAAVPEPSLEQALQAQDSAWCWLLDHFSNLVPVAFTELHAQSF